MALKKLDVYIMRSFLGPLLVCFLAIVGLYVVMDAFDKLEDFLSHGALMLVPLMAKYYFFNVPIFTIQLLPAIILIAVCFTLVKMSRANEILAMRAAGVSTYRILLPLFVAAVTLSVVASLVQEVAVPRFARGLEEFNRTVLGDTKQSVLDGQIREANDVYTIYKFWNYDFNRNEASRVELIRIDNRRSSSLFRVEDIKDPAGLAVKLRSGSHPLSQRLRARFRPETQRLLEEYDGARLPSKSLMKALAAELTRLIKGDFLYDERLFADVALTEGTRRLVRQDVRGKDVMYLNRLLLEEAYPNEIAKRHRIQCLIAEGGGKWENGKWVLDNVVVPGTERLPPVRAIVVDPTNPDRLCLGMARWGIFMSDDGGKRWTKTNEGLSDSDRDIRCLATAPQTQGAKNAMLFAGSVGGVFEFDHGRKAWINLVKRVVTPKLSEIPELKAKKLDLKAYAPDKSVNDIIRKAYRALGENDDALERIASVFDIPNGVAQEIGAYSDFVDIKNVRTILVDSDSGPEQKIRLYIGTDSGIAELERSGGIWRRPEAYRSRPRRLRGKAIRALVKDAEGRLCAGASDGVYRRDEPNEKRGFFGNMGLKQLEIKALSVRENTLFAATPKGVFRREITPSRADKSASGEWESVSDGLTSLNVQTLTKDEGGALYAGTSNGTFRFEFGGGSWSPLPGLEGECVKSLAVAGLDPRGPKTIYAGTLTKGVFKYAEKAQVQREGKQAAPTNEENEPSWTPINSDDLQQKLPKLYFKTSLRPEKLEAGEIDPGLKSFHELRDLCRSEPDKPSYRVMMHTRASYPLTGLVLLLLGVPFIIGFEKLSRSRFLGVAACAALCGAFYALTFFCASLGDSGAINPALAAWIPVILSGAVGLFLLDSINV